MTQQMTRREVMRLGIAGTIGASVAANARSSETVASGLSSSIVVDANMHWLPETLFSDSALLERFIGAVPREYGIHAKVMGIPGKELRQIVIEMPKGYEVLNYAENQYSSRDQVADMDRARVDKAVLRLPCWQEWVDLETCKLINNGLAEHTKRYPGRFYALAVAPPWGSKESLKEVERCITGLGFRGVQMAAHYGELYLDEEEFRPYFSFLNQLGVPVVVHHTPLPVDYRSISKYANQRRQYGRCIAQGTAVGRELFGGMFGEFPNLKLVHSMLGGGFFAFANMLVPERANFSDAVDRFQDQTERIRGYLRNNLYFDLSGAPQWGKAQLECAVKVLGADHILYGGSYPIRRDWFMNGPDYVRSLEIPESDKLKILGANAVGLFRLG
ncbi:MAG: amidohydrolase family protein [Acidobacteriia bacterium]|nr:amidohydrolase family protein [Terriglobia bacterium]